MEYILNLHVPVAISTLVFKAINTRMLNSKRTGNRIDIFGLAVLFVGPSVHL